jgi:hypothetical protein
MTFSRVLSMLAFLATTALIPLTASAKYRVEVRSDDMYSFGFILSHGKVNNATLRLYDDERFIEEVPVTVEMSGLGATVGVSRFVKFRTYIVGLESDRLEDLMGTYKGLATGGSYLIPGPCCIAGGKLSGTLKHIKNEKLTFYFEATQGVGLSVDVSNITIQLNHK